MEEKYIAIRRNGYIEAFFDTPEKAKRYCKNRVYDDSRNCEAMAVLIPKGSKIYRDRSECYCADTFSPLYEEKKAHLQKLFEELDTLKKLHGIYTLEAEIKEAKKEMKREVTTTLVGKMFMKEI